MIYKQLKRSIITLLCAVMLFIGLSFNSHAANSNSFVLFASTTNETVIEPVSIPYEAGQTIRDALKASEYTFEGIDESMITAVNSISGSYNIFCSDEAYDIDREAVLVTTVEFTELTEDEINFDSRAELLIAMENYLSMDNGVQDYAPAAEAYEKAIKGLHTANTDSEALLTLLNEEISNYDKMVSGNDITVHVSAYQGETLLNNAYISFTDKDGYTRKAVGSSIRLGRAGEYQFVVSDGMFNRTEGTVTVPENGGNLEVQLPTGEWFGEIRVTRPDFTDETQMSRVPYSGMQDQENHTAEFFIEDAYDYEDELLYINAKKGGDIPSIDKTTLRCVYTGFDGEDKSESLTSWESRYAQLSSALAFGMEGRTFSLEAWYDYTEGESTYRMIQSYDVTLSRIPTCTNIILKDADGVSLLKNFHGKIYEYNVTTGSDTLTTETELFGAEGYSISMMVNGNAVNGMTANLQKGENELSIIVSHTNGQSNTYVFHVLYEDTCSVAMNLQGNDYSYEIFNENDSKIEAFGENVYHLIPGEKYYYIATKDGNYHTTADFTAANGLKVSVAEPKIEEGLQAVAVYDTANVSNRLEIPADQTFSSNIFEYSYAVSDALTGNAYLQATPVSGYAVTAIYEGLYSASNKSISQKTEITTVVDSAAKATSLGRVYVKGGYGNVIILRAAKESDSCIYYQDYTLKLNRYLSLNTLDVSMESGNCILFDAEENMVSFERDTFSYYIYLPTSAEQLSLNGHFMNEGDSEKLWYNGGYYASINGQKITALSNITISLDPAKASEIIEIHVCHENADAKVSTYTLHLVKKDAIDVTFKVTPKDALVFVVNALDGTRVYPDDKGVLRLMPGFSYHYTVTANGYVGKNVKNYKPNASQDNSKVTVMLAKAQKNNSLKDLSSLWPTFRDSNNNVILDEKIPIKSEDTVLYWALGKDTDNTDDLIDGFDGSCGHPILVDGYLYTYDNQRIYKIDTIDGSIAAVSTDKLVAKSSFAIQGMTYGEGMVFVGLSNGSVQAFNADTLESLWVYEDEVGGQPNSVITYRDGYIYTGFWISETAYANYVCISVTDENPEDHFEKKSASWVHHQKGGFYWAGAYLTDQFLLVGTDDGKSGYTTGYAHLLSLNPKTGEVLSDLTLPHAGDLRTSITYDSEGTKDYYFTTKGGFFYRVSVDEAGMIDEKSLQWVQLDNGTDKNAMSTSTPTIYNGRAYVGVSGTGQFVPYGGHNISVIDLTSMKTVYKIPTKGYPQTSGILTTAYSGTTKKVHVYFFDNYTPGKLRMFSDEPGQTELLEVTVETQQTSKGDVLHDTGYVLFTPVGSQAQYAICSPVVDEYGTMYFRNDSNYMMAIGSTLEKIEVIQQPKKTSYRPGTVFDPTGMTVIATYTNGMTRDITDYVSYSQETLTENDTEFSITFEHVMYQDQDGNAGVEYTAPMTFIPLTINNDVSEESEVVRIYGNTRYETSFAIADTYKEKLGIEKFDTVIVANGRNFADALAGSYLSSVKNAPILLYNNKKSNLTDIEMYLEENLISEGTVYVLGGTAAVGDDVDKLNESYTVKRLSGITRYDTNLEILKETGITDQDILIATGKNFADSLSSSAAKRPILLVGKKLTDAQKAFLSSLNGNKLYILGGTAAVSENIEEEIAKYGSVTRISGKSRYETSVLIAEEFFETPKTVVFANAKNFPDGLCGGSLAVSMDAPLILTATGNTAIAEGYVQENTLTSGVVLGGTGALSDEAVVDIFKLKSTENIIIR